jgi:hypothetical protein
MLMRTIGDLLGHEVHAKDGRFGVLEDIYFDRDCWDLCYLLIVAGDKRALVSSACIEPDSAAEDRLCLALSRAQLAGGAGAWPMDDAVRWLEDVRVCSARHAVGWRVLAEDGPVGVLADLLIERRTWSILYLVANPSEVFGSGQIRLSLDWAEPLEPLEATVRMRRTRAQLRSSPAGMDLRHGRPNVTAAPWRSRLYLAYATLKRALSSAARCARLYGTSR